MANYIRTTDDTYPHSEASIRAANPQTSFPALFRADGYEVVFPAPAPAHDPITQSVRETTPELTVLGTWEQRWEVVALDATTIAVNQVAEATRVINIETARVASLWQAAHDYEYAQISGSAIGLLAIGVMQAQPKCIAVQNWIRSIWTEYYTRKAGTSTNGDYSLIGACPHSVPELMVELGL